MILVVGDRFTRKVWATSLPGKTNQEVLDGFKDLWPQILKDAGSSTAGQRVTTKTDSGPKQIVVDSATCFTSKELAHG